MVSRVQFYLIVAIALAALLVIAELILTNLATPVVWLLAPLRAVAWPASAGCFATAFVLHELNRRQGR